MLSPKMSRTIRVNESQLMSLSEKARAFPVQSGYLYKRSADSSKWHLRWFILFQNLLFYYDNEESSRPSGVIFLESSRCFRLIIPGAATKSKDNLEGHILRWQYHCFTITYLKENVRDYELKALNEMECNNWIEAIRQASFSSVVEQREQIEQKQLHLMQIMESENTAKWTYARQCFDSELQIKSLKAELFILRKKLMKLEKETGRNASAVTDDNLDEEELRKIKKVQSFFRGWLCRRRWKQIVEQYIKSPQAESMRKRNSLIFRMVEAEEEYMEQLEILVTSFFRPFKMAASSKKPPCTHEDVNSIFLNSETVLFLHQIFLKGLTTRLESWPTLVLGDLFSMLLPMLSIYQEYVRNHHYSLQVLTECKQSAPFAQLLDRLENKPACNGRSLEQFLTYPMHQVPRYIITLHELLAHTPLDHVERKSLQNARQQLEDLSRLMHDEVSETENLRKNLSIERMIIEGCEILLDVNQVFVRQGNLLQLQTDRFRSFRNKLYFRSEKEAVRHCFLFSNHLIITTRTNNGKFHLVPDIGKIPLADALLIEDPNERSYEYGEASGSACSTSSPSTSTSETVHALPSYNLHNRDFMLIVELKTATFQGQCILHFQAPTIQEKAAWISDLSQCLDNVQLNDMLRPTTMSDNSSISLTHSIKNDPKLFRDEADIKFSRTMNSCKVPQIRYATPERLLQRLTDLRFLSVDFLNTFLLTYRVFTDGATVLEALKKVFYTTDPDIRGSVSSLEVASSKDESSNHLLDDRRRSSVFTPRRISGASSVSGYCSEVSERDRSHSYDSQGHRQWKCNLQKYEEEEKEDKDEIECAQSAATAAVIGRHTPSKASKSSDLLIPSNSKQVPIRAGRGNNGESKEDNTHLAIPKVPASSSSETLTDAAVTSASCSPSNVSSTTLVASSPSDTNDDANPNPFSNKDLQQPHQQYPQQQRKSDGTKVSIKPPAKIRTEIPLAERKGSDRGADVRLIERAVSEEDQPDELSLFYSTIHRSSCSSSRSASISTTTTAILQNYYSHRKSIHNGEISARSSFQQDSPQKTSKPGVVITSFRQSKRRSSTSGAAAAFAVAISASSNPRDPSPTPRASTTDPHDEFALEKSRHKDNVISTASTMRVLNVLRHWISKHFQDFEADLRLKTMTIEFLEDIIYSPNLLLAEHKAAVQLLRLLTKEDADSSRINIQELLYTPITVPVKDNIETLSALEIAEQLTYIDHQIFTSISSDEFLGQAWMKADKNKRAPHIILMTKRFNEVSRLVASEIIRRQKLSDRAAAIEKWAAVADIARCLHNFNGVLQICSAFTNSAVFRLKKTWDKVSKTSIQTIEKLQNIVSSDGRFRTLRDALHRSDPPCIPYLGLYLTDLSFIEEGTPNFTHDGLLNFSKMRMIAHVIREIRHFQMTNYKIKLIRKVANYLLDSSLLFDDEELYTRSLRLEPRTTRLSNSGL